MKIRSNKTSKKIFLLSATFSLLFASYVYAQSEIKFPVAELGNCGSKEECRAYCDEDKNFPACRAFAKKHKLQASEQGEKFEAIEKDGGPGSCAKNSDDPEGACHAYCNISAHMKECVAYAKTHNLMENEELEEAEKVLRALDAGAKLPAGCENKESCEKICGEPANVSIMRECFAFAEAAGLLPPDVSREQAEKMFKAIEEGRAPFKHPKDFEQCENPATEEILEKCVNFGLENGFITGEEAEMVRKTGGKGPGGCRGKEKCEAYCEANQDECFAFAEEHGLIKEEDRTRMQEGMNKFKEGLSQAPAEVRTCLEETLGSETMEQILSGKKRPSEQLGQSMRACFEKMGPVRGREGSQRPSASNGMGGPGAGGENGMMGPRDGKFPPEGKNGENREERMRGEMPYERPDEKEGEGFPGRENMSEEMKRMYEERSREMQGERTDQYFRQFPEGERPPQYEGEYRGEYQQQYQGEYRGEYQTPSQEFQYMTPPEGGIPMMPPSPNRDVPPPGTQMPPGEALASGIIFFLNFLLGH